MPERPTIVVPVAETVNNAIRNYVLLFCEAAREFMDVVAFDFPDEGERGEALKLLVEGRAGHYVSFSNVGHLFADAMPVASMTRLFEESGATFCHLDLDHPSVSHARMGALPAGSIYTNATRACLPLARALTGAGVHLDTLAHGSVSYPVTPWEERRIDCLFAGNLNTTPTAILESWGAFPAHVREVLFSMKEISEGGTRYQPEDLYLEAEQGEGLPVHRRAIFAMQQFDAYARTRARFDLVERVTEAPITFLGRGWSDFPAPNRTFLGSTDAEGAIAAMQDARVVLNVTADYYASHERVFQGLSMGCAVATYGCDFVANAEGVEPGCVEDPIVYMTPADMDATLAALVADRERARDVGERSRQRFLEAHTWSHRARRLLAIMRDAGAFRRNW